MHQVTQRAILYLGTPVVLISTVNEDGSANLAPMWALLSLADDKKQSCEAVDVITRERLGDVKRKLADLAALRQELDSLISQCRHGTVAHLRIIEALAPAR